MAIQALPRHQFLWNGIGAVGLAFSFFLSTIFLLKFAEDYSRGAFLFQLVSVAVTVLGLRATAYSRLQSAIASGLIEARRVVLIGDAEYCSRFAARLRLTGIKTVRCFSFPEAADTDAVASAAGDAAISRSRKMVEECRALRVDDILLLAGEKDLPIAGTLAHALSELPIDLHVVPVEAIDLMGGARIGEIGNMITMQVARRPLSTTDRIVKRTFDIVAAVVGLILFSPLLLMVAIAIKLDSPGPVFFRQTRHGFNNDPIRVFKFRSMTVMEDGAQQFTQAVKNDRRVTRIGRILRRANIDELPQLFNVLIGEMSMVGPRPHATAHNQMFEQVIFPFSRRHNVKPGITGWAQVSGYRGETDTVEKMRRRVEYDLYYIDNWSFLFDMKIIIMTLFSKTVYMNAY